MINQKKNGETYYAQTREISFDETGCRHYVRHPSNTDYKVQYTEQTVKHSGEEWMIWGCFPHYGMGPIQLKNETYVEILKKAVLL